MNRFLYRFIAAIITLSVFAAVILTGGLGAVTASAATDWSSELVLTVPETVISTEAVYSGKDEVVFNDETLETFLKELLNVPYHQSLTKAELATVHGGLDLSNKGIKDISGLEWAVNVTVLDLSGNSITSIPEEFDRIAGLTALDLGGNSISSLPDTFWNLEYLTKLWLNGNPLTSLSKKVSQLSNLQLLNLNGTSISSLPAALCNVRGLRILCAGKTQLTSLPEKFSMLNVLEYLDLSDCNLQSLPDGVASPELKYLNVSDNSLTELNDSLSRCINMEMLIAYDNLIDTFPACVNSMSELEVCKLMDNYISEIPEDTVLPQNDCLNINFNYLDIENADVVAHLQNLGISELNYSNQNPKLALYITEEEGELHIHWNDSGSFRFTDEGVEGTCELVDYTLLMMNPETEHYEQIAELDTDVTSYTMDAPEEECVRDFRLDAAYHVECELYSFDVFGRTYGSWSNIVEEVETEIKETTGGTAERKVYGTPVATVADIDDSNPMKWLWIAFSGFAALAIVLFLLSIVIGRDTSAVSKANGGHKR